jgi:hypothetical protein
MKTIRNILTVSLFAMACFSVAQAQDTRESAVAHMRKTEAKEMDASFTTAAPFAQKLVDQALAAHPEVILMAIHAVAPKYDIIASNFGRIGKLGDEDDLRCIHTGKANLEIDATGTHYEVELALKDKAGRTVGALGVVFNYKPGDDKASFKKSADAIAAAMTPQIKNSASLLGPA